MKALVVLENQVVSESGSQQTVAGTRILGVTILERAIATTMEAGIRDFVIAGNQSRSVLKSSLNTLTRQGARISWLDYRPEESGTAVSVLRAKPTLTDPFLMLFPDRIFDPRIVKALAEHESRSSVVAAVDINNSRRHEDSPTEEGHRFFTGDRDGRVTNQVPVGIYLCTPTFFDHVAASVADGATEVTSALERAEPSGDVELYSLAAISAYVSKMRKDIAPWWVPVRTRDDLRAAQQILVNNASKNPSDALAYFVHKPVENWLVTKIARYPITPNQVSILVNVLAYTITGLFATGYLLPASILTFVVGIADGLDGKLARVKMMTTRIGSLEHVFDLLYEFSWIMAFAYYLNRSTGSASPILAALLILTFISFYRTVYDRFGKEMGRSLDDSGSFERLFRKVAGRRNLYNIAILVGVVTGYPMYALTFILMQSGITALVYSVSTLRQFHALDSGSG